MKRLCKVMSAVFMLVFIAQFSPHPDPSLAPVVIGCVSLCLAVLFYIAGYDIEN